MVIYDHTELSGGVDIVVYFRMFALGQQWQYISASRWELEIANKILVCLTIYYFTTGIILAPYQFC